MFSSAAILMVLAAALSGCQPSLARIWDTGVVKDQRCHMLKIGAGCNVSLYKILDFKHAGYFYHAPFKSCRPYYMEEGSVCPMNKDLPKTKIECEKLCGEKCPLPTGGEGICMYEGNCDKLARTVATSDPRPCGAYNVQCCPKNTNVGDDQRSPAGTYVPSPALHPY